MRVALIVILSATKNLLIWGWVAVCYRLEILHYVQNNSDLSV